MAKYNIGKPKIQNNFWYQFFASFHYSKKINIFCASVDFLESNTEKKPITDVKNQANRLRATTIAIAK